MPEGRNLEFIRGKLKPKHIFLDSMATKPNTTKLLFVGNHNTGKTSIARRYAYKQFDEHSVEPTIGMDIASKNVRVNEMILKVQIWDIAGQDENRFIGLAPPYYRHAVAVVVVFDITNSSSLQNAKKWKTDIDDKLFAKNDDNVPVILFANKWDLIEENPERRQVSDSELDAFCLENNFVRWFSTSSKSGMNVKKGMNFLIGIIYQKAQTKQEIIYIVQGYIRDVQREYKWENRMPVDELSNIILSFYANIEIGDNNKEIIWNQRHIKKYKNKFVAKRILK
eukprot:16825_1